MEDESITLVSSASVSALSGLSMGQVRSVKSDVRLRCTGLTHTHTHACYLIGNKFTNQKSKQHKMVPYESLYPPVS